MLSKEMISRKSKRGPRNDSWIELKHRKWKKGGTKGEMDRTAERQQEGESQERRVRG